MNIATPEGPETFELIASTNKRAGRGVLRTKTVCLCTADVQRDPYWTECWAITDGTPSQPQGSLQRSRFWNLYPSSDPEDSLLVPILLRPKEDANSGWQPNSESSYVTLM